MGIGAGQCDSVPWESIWVHVAASETILSEGTIVNFECGVAMWRVMISEIDMAELWRSYWKWNKKERHFPSVVI